MQVPDYFIGNGRIKISSDGKTNCLRLLIRDSLGHVHQETCIHVEIVQRIKKIYYLKIKYLVIPISNMEIDSQF